MCGELFLYNNMRIINNRTNSEEIEMINQSTYLAVILSLIRHHCIFLLARGISIGGA